MKRRTFLKFSMAAAGGALAAPYVHAQSKKFAGITLRMNGFGGKWDAALLKAAAPLEEKHGLKVQMDTGTQSAQLIKLLAQKDDPPFDVFQGDSPYMIELARNGMIEEIKVSDVPNIKRILPGFREFGDYGVPFSLTSMGPAYNPKFVKPALTSYSDLARPDLKGRVVVFPATSSPGSLFLLGLAEENGGSISNMEPAYKVLEAAKSNIVALAQSTTPQMQMYQAEEVYAGVFWKYGTYQLNSKGFPIEFVVPPVGIYSVTTYLNIVKSTKFSEAAHALAEQFLSDGGMLAIAEGTRSDIATDFKLPEELRNNVVFASPERIAQKKKIDWKAWEEGHSARIERFNRIIRG
ncbi:extracellular solute-binding protein [Bradyrhizobium japonicum]|uniref:extracellular solute-binding protein n=1 Tax=Bradyrhizobium japonicum TaxID=375 RepID=UPI003515CDC2